MYCFLLHYNIITHLYILQHFSSYFFYIFIILSLRHIFSPMLFVYFMYVFCKKCVPFYLFYTVFAHTKTDETALLRANQAFTLAKEHAMTKKNVPVFSYTNMNGVSDDDSKHYSYINMNGISDDDSKHYSYINMNGVSDDDSKHYSYINMNGYSK